MSRVLFLFCALAYGATDPARDFSGPWALDRSAGEFRQLPPPDETLSVAQTNQTIECSAGRSRWTFPLDGGDAKYQVGNERWSSAAKWEGSALLINTLVMGVRDYTIMERWQLSADHQALNISRQIVRGNEQVEGRMVYRRPGAPSRAPEPSAAALTRRPDAAPAAPPAEREYVIPAGTKVLLSLTRGVSTKYSQDGDAVYLTTAFPVTIDGRILVPKGSTVTGTVSNAKRPGKVAGKGELYIRFEQLILPNGTTRDFRSRLGSADGGSGDVDRNEGAVKGTGNRTGDAKTVGTGAGAGATLGGVIGRSAGAAGIGGAAGAAAGLATVLMRRGPDPTLPAGTQVEMVLDRDVRFRESELAAH